MLSACRPILCSGVRDRGAEAGVAVIVGEDHLIDTLKRVECQVYVVSGEIGESAWPDYKDLVRTSGDADELGIGCYREPKLPFNLLAHFACALVEAFDLFGCQCHVAECTGSEPGATKIRGPLQSRAVAASIASR